MASEEEAAGVEDVIIAIGEMDGRTMELGSREVMRMLDRLRDGRTMLIDGSTLMDGTTLSDGTTILIEDVTMLLCDDSAVEELTCSEVEEGRWGCSSGHE
jgi:hypothetical protein